MRHPSFAVVAAVLALAGCEARTETSLAVRGDAVAITAKVTLGAEASVAARQDGAEAAIRDAFVTQAGLDADSIELHEDDDVITYEASLTYEQLVKASDVLGVSSATLSADEDRSTLTVVLVPPTELAGALREAAAGQPDQAAVADALLGTVEVGVRVTFAGGIDDATFSPAPNALDTSTGVTFDDSSATVRQSVSRFAGGKLTVVGDPDEARSAPWGTITLIGAFGAAAAWWAQQADRRNRARRRLRS